MGKSGLAESKLRFYFSMGSKMCGFAQVFIAWNVNLYVSCLDYYSLEG